MILKAIPLLLICVLLVSCGDKKKKDSPEDISRSGWKIFRGDSGLTGRSSVKAADSYVRAWRFKTEDEIKSSPVTDGKTVFIGSLDSFVYAVDLNSGKLKWKFKTGNGIEGAPLIVENSLIIGNLDGTIYSLKLEDGKLNWKVELERKVAGSANVFRFKTGKYVILQGCYDSKMHCIDFLTGRKLWAYDTKNYINGTGAIFEKSVVFGGCDSLLHKVLIEDGSSLNKVKVYSYAAGSPSVFGNHAYLGNYDGQILCIDLKLNKIVWTYEDTEEGDAFFSSPAVNEKYVIAGARNRVLYCIDRTNGKLIWQFKALDDIDSSAVICGDRILTASSDGRIYILNIKDGSKIWSYEIGSPVTGTPAVTEDMIVAGAEDGYIYCFKKKTS